MKVAFDIHGVIDTYPEVFIPMIDGMRNAGIEICIISGPPREQIIEDLYRFDIFWKVELKNVFSVVDYLKNSGIKMWQDKKGDWWTDDENWWNSKAKICVENNIDMIVDDSLKYKPAFENVALTFVHVDDIILPKDKVKNMKISEKEFQILDSIISDEYHDGRDPLNDPVWVKQLDTEVTGRSKAGVISSLTKKGFVGTNGESIFITEDGMKAWGAKIREEN